MSHYHGPAGQLTALLDDARRGGADITFDSYPYVRGCTTLAMVTLPGWLLAAGLRRDPGRAFRRGPPPGWIGVVRRRDLLERITLSHASARPALNRAQGAAAAARQAGRDPATFCRELLVATGLEAGSVFGHPAAPGAGARTSGGGGRAVDACAIARPV